MPKVTKTRNVYLLSLNSQEPNTISKSTIKIKPPATIHQTRLTRDRQCYRCVVDNGVVSDALVPEILRHMKLTRYTLDN